MQIICSFTLKKNTQFETPLGNAISEFFECEKRPTFTSNFKPPSLKIIYQYFKLDE